MSRNPDHWHLIAGFERFLALNPEAAPEFEADLRLIGKWEYAATVLDQKQHLPAPLAAELIADMRRLLAALFRTRVERDRFRADLHLLEQGQPLLFPLTEPQKPTP